MIKSFCTTLTQKVFNGETLLKKERKASSNLNQVKAQEALKVLDKSTEKQLLTTPSLAYHRLSGTNRYSIDAIGRKSKWRITFAWVDGEKTDVDLVKIEDTHTKAMITRDIEKISKPRSNPAVGLLMDTIEHFGLTQIAAAKGLCISRSYLNGVLKSKRGVSVDLALRAQAYLGISAELLVKLQAQYDFEKSYHENYSGFEKAIVKHECA